MRRNYRLALVLLVAWFAFAYAADSFAAGKGGQVSVKGYFRKDGTYVQPHVRSAPDGNPYNNYSFPGNYNPNTGEITSGDPDKYLERYYEKRTKGSSPYESPAYSVPAPTLFPKSAPPASSSPLYSPPPYSSSPPRTDPALSTAERIKRNHGINVDTSRSLSELLDLEARLNTVARIRRNNGLALSPDTSLSQLLDMEARLNTAARIKRNHRVNTSPDSQTLSSLLDLEARLNAAARIKIKSGVDVDSNTHSLADLLQLESGLYTKRR